MKQLESESLVGVRHPIIKMVASTFSRNFLGLAVLSCLFTTACVVTSCPSPSVVYASKGDDVTLCWKLPKSSTKTPPFRTHVKTLSRPVDEEMMRIATANETGHIVREFKKNHKGLYFGRVKLHADFKKGFFYFTMLNYTSKLGNIYCVDYQMTGLNDIKGCHVNSVTVRNYPGDEFFRTTPTPATKGDEFFNSTSTVKAPGTKGERVSAHQTYKIPFIVAMTVVGILAILLVVVLMLYCRVSQKK
ncbi:uncharacterized protein [Acropora muricata]|uniref:uncharacterized protein isoform X2 n=2 Tax=Acropora muricata TaxID=159855 RepID=UPI0034E4121F